MAFWTSTYLEKVRNFLARTITRASYRVSNTWYEGTINSFEVIDTKAVVFIGIPSGVPPGSVTITGVRLYDHDGELAAEQPCNIVRTGMQNALIKFEFELTEV
jgi:hypothetical protein